MEKEKQKPKELDYKDTAGYRLMQHEEYLKKMIRKGDERRKAALKKTV